MSSLNLLEIVIPPSSTGEVFISPRQQIINLKKSLSSSTQIHYIFEIIGEFKIFLVVDCYVDSVLETIYGNLSDKIIVTSTPIYPYETLASEILGADKALTDLPNPLKQRSTTFNGEMIWFTVDFQFKGADFSYFVKRWKEEAEAIYKVRQQCIEWELYKVVGTHKVYGAIQVSGEDFDKSLFNVLPMFCGNHEYLTINLSTKRVRATMPCTMT